MVNLLLDATGEALGVDHRAPLGARADLYARVIERINCIANLSTFSLR
ncbi:MAG: hypothetical protein ACXW6T_08805 [Candidatus Binatia bacterium]